MYWLGGLIPIVGGLLAASGFIIAKKAKRQRTYRQTRPIPRMDRYSDVCLGH